MAKDKNGKSYKEIGYKALLLLFMLHSNNVFAADSCIPAEILKDDKFAYDSSMTKWLSYVDFSSRQQSNEESQQRSFRYGQTSLTANDARSAASYFINQSHYNLSEQQQNSVLYTHLSNNRLQAYISCLKYNQNNIIIEMSPGAEAEETFQAVVQWKPKYQVKSAEGTNTRKPDIAITNGSIVTGNGQIIAPDDSIVLTINRLDLAKPLTLVVSIDGKTSEIINFPSVPQYSMAIVTQTSETEKHVRGGQTGTSGISTEIHCIDAADNGAFLADSAKVTIVGGGLEWNTRTGGEITTNDPKKICFRAMSFGDTCPDPKCTYYYKGVLSVKEAVVSKIVR